MMLDRPTSTTDRAGMGPWVPCARPARLSLVLLLTIAGCASTRPTPPTSSAERAPERAGIGTDASAPVSASGLAYVMRTLSRSPEGCTVGNPDCPWVRFHWPDFAAASGSPAAASIDAWTLGALAHPGHPSGGRESDLEGTADRFLAEALAPGARAGGSGPMRQLDRTASVELDTARVVSLRVRDEHASPAGRGQTTTALTSRSAASGQSLTLGEMIAPEDQPTLLGIVEGVLRRVRSVPSGAPLAQAGLKLDGATLAASEQIAIGPRGLSILWPTGTIAAPSAGAIEILVEWSELRPIARPGTLLGDEIPRAH